MSKSDLSNARTRWTFCIECNNNFETSDPEQLACSEVCIVMYVHRRSLAIEAVQDEAETATTPEPGLTPRRRASFDLLPK